MARYQVTLRDAAFHIRRMFVWSVVRALAVVAVAFLFGILASPVLGGSGAFMLTFGIGLGVAAEILTTAFQEYDRAKLLYGPNAEPIELTVTPEQIVFATEGSDMIQHHTIRRTPNVKVAESRGSFLITVGRWKTPTLVPAHRLSADEAELLRQWTRS